MSRLIFLFVDGLGLGPGGPQNPFSRMRLPGLESVLGGRLLLETPRLRESERWFQPLDATLGVEGLPQSATGQTTIWTGHNAARHMGQHISGFPLARLRRLIEAGNLYTYLAERGLRGMFVNAFTPEYFRMRTTQRGWVACSTRAAWSAGLKLCGVEELRQNRALTHDLVRAHPYLRGYQLPQITPEQAAEDLLALAQEYHFLFHETFLTDRAGHARDEEQLQVVMERLDRFLSHLLANKDPDMTVLITSDHGNCEDMSVKTHTTNPVPLIVTGQGASRLQGLDLRDLTDIVPAILAMAGQQEGEEA